MSEKLSPDLVDRLALALIPGLGPKLTAALLERFRTMAAIRRATEAELREVQAATETELSRRTAAHPQLFATSARKGRGLEALKDHIAALAEAWGGRV